MWNRGLKHHSAINYDQLKTTQCSSSEKKAKKKKKQKKSIKWYHFDGSTTTK